MDSSASGVVRFVEAESFSSVILTCRWSITIGFTSAGSRTSPSTRTIWLGCGLYYLRRWLSLRIVCCHHSRPAQPRCVRDIGPLPLRPAVVSASLAAPPWEDGLAISGVGPEGVAIPELGVAPLVDSGTDLQDELSTPDDSPSVSTIRPEVVVVLPGARPAPPDVIDFELEKALLQVSMLPMMVTQIVDPEVPGTSYPAPPLPVPPMDEQIPVSETSPLWEGAGSPILDVFPSYMSPAGSEYGPATSPVSPSFKEEDVSVPPSGPVTMDQYLPRDSALLLGGVDGLAPSGDASNSSPDCRGDGTGVGCRFTGR